MKPVESMTPAAKALIMKNTFLSGLKAGIVFPRIGRQTPMAPATRMEAMAAILYLRAKVLLCSSLSDSHVHSPRARMGSTAMRKKRWTTTSL
ncbi:hypothetical protein TorRG33x02_060500 [Trema orientale]|uniref:Uncharacterized protein n=1 Tax=Trema orientale TaxID=63057 RepID=A0A2P5FKA1_TREOI|nr:hypothetical protein TorRG33x02_060500 [Trema orientale]